MPAISTFKGGLEAQVRVPAEDVTGTRHTRTFLATDAQFHGAAGARGYRLWPSLT